MQALGFVQAGLGQADSNMSAYATRYRYYDEAKAAEASVRDVDLQAAQAGEARAYQLNQAVSAIEARRAASGLSVDSPTAQAIERQVRKEAARAGQVAAASASQQRLGLYAKAKALRQAGYDAAKIMDLKHDAFGTGHSVGGQLTSKMWGKR